MICSSDRSHATKPISVLARCEGTQSSCNIQFFLGYTTCRHVVLNVYSLYPVCKIPHWFLFLYGWILYVVFPCLTMQCKHLHNFCSERIKQFEGFRLYPRIMLNMQHDFIIVTLCSAKQLLIRNYYYVNTFSTLSPQQFLAP